MFLLFFIIFVFFSCGSEKSTNPGVIARVNGEVLTKEMLYQLVGGEFLGPRALLHATNQWVEKNLLLSAAIDMGLKKDKDLINKKNTFYRDPLVSSYLDIKTKTLGDVSKKEVSDYYNKHKKSFTRNDDEVVVKHFIIPTKKESDSVKKTLKRNRNGKKIEEIIKKYKPETRFLLKNRVKDNLVGFVFSGDVGAVLGPKKFSGGYHLFQILKKHKKESIRGLELVYDEINQRLYKQKESSLLAFVLDSLYSNSDVFISPGVFE